MMRLIVIVLLLHLNLAASAQVINSLSKDQTGFYTHALDSVIRIIKKERVLHTVFIVGRECVKEFLPDSLQGIIVKWLPPTSKKNRSDKREGEAIVMINCLSIIRDEVTVSIMTPRQGDWLYVFKYYYQHETKDYKLKVVKRGMML